jgi:NitT/TauT family transport system permease protein
MNGRRRNGRSGNVRLKNKQLKNPRPSNKQPKAILPGLIGWGLFLPAWELIYRIGLFHPLVFPSLGDILQTVIRDFGSAELPLTILSSLLLILAAFLPSLALALLVCGASVFSARIRNISHTLSTLAHPLPGIVLLPLLIIWTGLGRHIIVLVVVHSVLWPLIVNLQSGLDETPRIWLDLGRNNRLNPHQMFFRIMLPGAWPYLLAGLKIGWARAWRAVISAEMIFGTISGNGGLGWYIFNKRIFMDTPGMYAGILVLILLGLAVDQLLFVPLETRMKIRRGGGL